MQDAYREVRAKVDAQFEKIYQKHRAAFSCAEGCHACCAPDLSVTRVEADVIRAYLAERPEVVESLKDLAQRDPHRGQRCALLDDEGRCRIL